MQTIGIDEPCALIHRLCRTVFSPGFDVYGANTVGRAEGPHLCQRPRAQPGTAKRWPNKQVIYKSTETAILHAVA
jgi:hypothetical protein